MELLPSGHPTETACLVRLCNDFCAGTDIYGCYVQTNIDCVVQPIETPTAKLLDYSFFGGGVEKARILALNSRARYHDDELSYLPDHRPSLKHRWMK